MYVLDLGGALRVASGRVFYIKLAVDKTVVRSLIWGNFVQVLFICTGQLFNSDGSFLGGNFSVWLQ